MADGSCGRVECSLFSCMFSSIGRVGWINLSVANESSGDLLMFANCHASNQIICHLNNFQLLDYFRNYQ